MGEIIKKCLSWLGRTGIKEMGGKYYNPEDFQQPRRHLPYWGTLSQPAYEALATEIIRTSQQAGEWKSASRNQIIRIVSPLANSQKIIEEMVNEGLLEKTAKDSFMLTDIALAKIHAKYRA